VRHLTADGAETERIGTFAAQALADIHVALYGVAPQATRAWTDGDAILLVMRLPGDSAARRSDPPLSAIQRLVGATVYRRTGVSLRTAGTNVDAQRGLVVLAFERIRTAGDQRDARPIPEDDAGPLPAGHDLGAG
jgi:hypothetical protein